VCQVTAAVRRADDDLGPATAGWGPAEIHGLTQNRSVEAHLADHGIVKERGSGSAAEDPQGVDHTIDPSVNVLRVDKLVGGRPVAIGGPQPRHRVRGGPARRRHGQPSGGRGA
jgi:hypothetical protein